MEFHEILKSDKAGFRIYFLKVKRNKDMMTVIYFHLPNLLTSVIYGLAKQISSWAIEMGVKIMFMRGQV